jgi:hypothetical protein
MTTGAEKLHDRVKLSIASNIGGKARHQIPIIPSRTAKPRSGCLSRVLNFPQR